MNEGCLCLGKGGVAFWMETEELNCPRKLGWEPRMVQGQRWAEQGWSIRRVGAGGHPWRGIQSGGLEHPLTCNFFSYGKKYFYIHYALKKKTNLFLVYLFI